jgi:hypothetical protein
MKLLWLAITGMLGTALAQTGGDVQADRMQVLAAAATASSTAPTDFAYGLVLGPELPGLGGSCDLMLPPLSGPGGEDVRLVSFRSWLSSLGTAVRATDQAAYAAGMSRLCSTRFDPEVNKFQGAVPAFSSPDGQRVINKLKSLAEACATGKVELYDAAYKSLCPPNAPLGPDMPPKCKATVGDVRSRLSAPRRIRLTRFIEDTIDLLEQSDATDDELWRRSMEGLCGERQYVAGVEFHSHRPLDGSPLFKFVHKHLSVMDDMCGAQTPDVKAYEKAWEALCPPAPTEGVAPAAAAEEGDEAQSRNDKLMQRYQAIREAVIALAHAATGAADSIHLAFPSDAPASVVAMEEQAAKVLQEIVEWEQADSLRDKPYKDVCKSF